MNTAVDISLENSFVTENLESDLLSCTEKAYAIARNLTASPADAQDLLQESYAIAMGALKSFRGEGTLQAWFLRLLINQGFRQWRQRKRWNKVRQWISFQEKRQVTPEMERRDSEIRERLDKALLTLPPGQRSAFVLRYLHDYTVSEVAQLTGKAEGTIKSHIFRAVRTLRKEMKDLR